MELKKIDEHRNIVEEIVPDSIASELEIEPGDEILSINGNHPKDIIDYKYLINDSFLTVEILKSDGEVWEFEIEKDFNEDLGIEFTNPLIDRAKRCSNKCIFCFIDQLPPNMRETLYFKDDDSRLSFLQGNFITLTNMSEEEIERIIKYHISPINISIHTTNPELRVKMLHNKNAGKAIEYLERFHQANLLVNCQIVSVPGVNDGAEMERTLRDLWKFSPSVNSVAIVPVGVTKYRNGLYDLCPYDGEQAGEIIDLVEGLQREFLKEGGTRFALLSDEFYVLADREVPTEEEYEGYPQIENGVGLIRSFHEELVIALKDAKNVNVKRDITFVTGTLAEKFMNRVAEMVMEVYSQLEVKVVGIVNEFFGETITVAGLVTGGDIISQLKEHNTDVIIIPRSMLKQDEEIFLDDTRLEELEMILGKPVIVAEVDGYELTRILEEEICYE